MFSLTDYWNSNYYGRLVSKEPLRATGALRNRLVVMLKMILVLTLLT